jgi:tetratricopeptide (TPR) repeat protein
MRILSMPSRAKMSCAAALFRLQRLHCDLRPHLFRPEFDNLSRHLRNWRSERSNLNRGNARYSLERYEQAVSDYNEAFKICQGRNFGEYAEAVHARGKAYRRDELSLDPIVRAEAEEVWQRTVRRESA